MKKMKIQRISKKSKKDYFSRKKSKLPFLKIFNQKYSRLNKNKSKNKNIINKMCIIFIFLILPVISIILYFLFKPTIIAPYFDNKYLNITVCICTLGKKENRYIKEWVEHYEKYGVDKIYLYDNNDPDGERFEEVIKDYIDKGFVEVLNWRGRKRPIMKIMTNCYQNNYNKYDWMMFYELDEFIHLDKYTSVKQFLYEEKFKDCPIVNLNLIPHTDNNQLHYENRPLSERFPEKVNYSKIYFEVKSILRGHIPNVEINCIHRLHRQFQACDAYGRHRELLTCEEPIPDYNHYYIDHYYSKSTEEFINKINRGDALFPSVAYKLARVKKLSKQVNFTKEKIEMIEKETGLNLSKYKTL